MASSPEFSYESIEFPERIGPDFELWKKYQEIHGPEAYKYRRLYEEVSEQLHDVYRFAVDRGIDLPDISPDFT